MSIIFISHDLSVIRKISDKVCVMKDGKIIESGETEQIFNAPKNIYTKTLINSFNILNNNKNIKNKTILSVENIRKKERPCKRS